MNDPSPSELIVDVIVDWFLNHNTPTDPDLGDDPNLFVGDAADMLYDEFKGLVTEPLLEQALKRIRETSWDWVRDDGKPVYVIPRSN